MKMIDLTGKKFNELEVLYKAGSNRRQNVTWLCRCKCGTEKIISANHLTRKKFPVKTCGCGMKKKGAQNPLWKGFGEISGGWWATHVLRERKQTARVKVPVEITIEYAWSLFLTQNRKCSLSGIPLLIGSNSYNNASIDRIDSSKGYVEGNIQWVDKTINFMKRTYSQEYFIKMCSLVYETSNNFESFPID